MTASKKHKLLSASGGEEGALRPCPFFASPAGCRNGASCVGKKKRGREEEGEGGGDCDSGGSSPRKKSRGKSGGDTETDDKLVLHRIPPGVEPKHISDMFLSHSQILPSEVPDVHFKSGRTQGRVRVRFRSADHAKLAFESLAGDAHPDSFGCPQKRIYLKGGGYVAVKLNVFK